MCNNLPAVAHEDCIFCKVLAGEIPSEKVYEDEHAVAVMDINPWTRGHLVVFPRKHAANVFEIEDAELERVIVAVKRVAAKVREALDPDGVNLLQSNGPAAWQTIFHLHFHVIPRYDDDPLELPTRPQPASPEELAEVAEEIRGDG
jgi:histidine triad (HIT) family protein